MTQFKGFSGLSEAQLKQLFAGMFTVTSSPLTTHTGVLGASGLAVRQTSTASASVTVDPGVALSMGTTLAGVTPLVNDTTATIDVLTANPMGGVPRWDVLVFDPGTVSGGTGGLRVIVGTPNAIPSYPTVPSTAIPLAGLQHADSATTVPTSAIDDTLRVFTSMRGGVVQVRNTTERDAFDQDATLVWRADAKTLELYDGTEWRSFAVSSSGKAGKRSHWATFTSADVNRSDATGIQTGIAHGCGFTPTVAVIGQNSIALQSRIFNLTSTTFDLQVVNSDGSANGTSSFSYSVFFGE